MMALRSVAGLVMLASFAMHAQDAALQAQIEALVHEPKVARAHWGVQVTKLDATPIAAWNEGQLFQPASNMKLFTTATVMAMLPAETKFQTTLEGTLRGATVTGELVLRGSGDANFSARTLPYVPRSQMPKAVAPPDELRYLKEMVAQLKAKGVTHVAGDVVGDDTYMPWDPYPQDWSIDDALWYYGAPINALMIADNSFNLKITPGAHAGDKAVVSLTPDLQTNFYTIDNQITTVDKGVEAHTEIQRSAWTTGGSRVVHLYGTIAIGGAQVEDLAIDDPAEYAAVALKDLLIANGVSVSGVAKARHKTSPVYTFTRDTMEPLAGPVPAAEPTKPYPVLAVHDSSPIYDDVVVTNKVSQNQHAELMLRQLGVSYGKDGSTSQGIRVVRSFLTTKVGIDPDDFISYDGSGLSGHDLVTPRATTQLLRYASTQPWGKAWAASLPVGGMDGSLASRFAKAPLAGHVMAKTGTLGEARALSGYLECASGQTVVFSIMVSLHTPRTHDDQVTMDRIVAAIQAAE